MKITYDNNAGSLVKGLGLTDKEVMAIGHEFAVIFAEIVMSKTTGEHSEIASVYTDNENTDVGLILVDAIKKYSNGDHGKTAAITLIYAMALDTYKSTKDEISRELDPLIKLLEHLKRLRKE